MSNAKPLNTLPDGTPNNTGLQIDSDTVQINVSMTTTNKQERIDTHIVTTPFFGPELTSIPGQWDSGPTGASSKTIGTIWKDGAEIDSFDIQPEIYERMSEQGLLDEYLIMQARGETDEAEAYAVDSPPTPTKR